VRVADIDRDVAPLGTLVAHRLDELRGVLEGLAEEEPPPAAFERRVRMRRRRVIVSEISRLAPLLAPALKRTFPA
jgi:hypothetical protein